MNKFSAEKFYRIGCLLGNIIQALNDEEKQFINLTGGNVFNWLADIHNECLAISLDQSWRAAKRTMGEFKTGIHQRDLKIRLDELQKLIGSEMEAQLFLWVPSHRAAWYGKDAHTIVGDQCCKRFSSIKREVEEASKCFATGRYTASGFHLTRATEAGVQALAKAIKFKPPHNQWTLVFDRMKAEFNTPPAQRPKHWKTHGKFLTMIWADLSLVAKVWRNDIMHLVVSYGEEEAKELFEVLPKFLRDLATKLDEKGKLYR